MKHIKPLLFFLLLILCVSLPLFGCSSRSAATVDIDPEEAAATLLEGLTFQDSLLLAQGSAVSNYYRLDETITGYGIYISATSATAEEIAVLQVDAQADLPKALEALESRVASQKTRYENYAPEEMVKLNHPVMVSSGTTAILVLCDDSAAAEKLANSILEGK